MRELSISEIGEVSGGVNWDEAGFGSILIGAGYGIAASTGVGVVVIGVGLVMGFAGGFFIGDGLANNGKYSEALDTAFEVDQQ
jgi:hypothetical protein